MHSMMRAWDCSACDCDGACQKLCDLIKVNNYIVDGKLGYGATPYTMCSWKSVPDSVLVGHFRCRCQLLCAICDSEHTFDPSRVKANKGI